MQSENEGGLTHATIESCRHADLCRNGAVAGAPSGAGALRDVWTLKRSATDITLTATASGVSRKSQGGH